MTGDFDFKKFIALTIIDLMVIAFLFFGFRTSRDLKSSWRQKRKADRRR